MYYDFVQSEFERVEPCQFDAFGVIIQILYDLYGIGIDLADSWNIDQTGYDENGEEGRVVFNLAEMTKRMAWA